MNYQTCSNNRQELEELFYRKEKELSALNEPRSDYTSTRLCSFNVHAFMEANTNPVDFKKLLSEINADVIGILEYDQESDDQYGYMKGFGYNYKIESRDTIIAVFSRLPIYNARIVCLGGLNNAIMITVDSLNICLLHLTYNNQYTRLNEIKQLLKTERSGTDVDIIMGDFNSAMIESISNPHEFHECYLNRTKVKYSSELFDILVKNNYYDSFKAALTRPNTPYSTHWSTYRIDYIFVAASASVSVNASSVYHTTLSDHIPVIADIMG